MTRPRIRRRLTGTRGRNTISAMRNRFAIAFGIGLAALVLAPVADAADDGVPVPNLEAPKASFTAAKGAERTFVARGADRARMVAFEAVLITGNLGSKVQLDTAPSEEDEPPTVVLLDGGFHAVVGSRPVALRLGDTSLRASRAAVIAVKLGKKWVVKVEPESDEGFAEVIPPAPPAPVEAAPDDGTDAEPDAEPDTEPDAEPAPAPAPPPEPIRLTPGKRHTLSSGEQRPAERSESQFLDKTIDRLIPGAGDQLLPTQRPQVVQLEPRDVEDPRDFVVASAGADAALGELELEDIEVDVGCVEICVD